MQAAKTLAELKTVWVLFSQRRSFSSRRFKVAPRKKIYCFIQFVFWSVSSNHFLACSIFDIKIIDCSFHATILVLAPDLGGRPQCWKSLPCVLFRCERSPGIPEFTKRAVDFRQTYRVL